MKVVLDIETIQAPREEWARLVGKLPSSGESESAGGGYDLFTAGAAEAQRRAEDEQYAKSSFDGTFSQIVCIGLLEFSDQLEPRGSVAWYGGDERELLRQFWSRLAQNRPSLFITHNGLGFDLPFIKKRSIIHQVKPSLDDQPGQVPHGTGVRHHGDLEQLGYAWMGETRRAGASAECRNEIGQWGSGG